MVTGRGSYRLCLKHMEFPGDKHENRRWLSDLKERYIQKPICEETVKV